MSFRLAKRSAAILTLCARRKSADLRQRSGYGGGTHCLPVLGAEGEGAGVTPFNPRPGLERGEARVAVVHPGVARADALGDVFAAVEIAQDEACFGAADEGIRDTGVELVIAAIETVAECQTAGLRAGAGSEESAAARAVGTDGSGWRRCRDGDRRGR